MIKIKNIEVKVSSKISDNKKILNWVNLEFEIWKNYCLLWKNWSGKSTLSSVLMWSPKYEVVWGEIFINSDSDWDNESISSHLVWDDESITSPLAPLLTGEGNEGINLLELSPEERSKAWIFLSFQNVPEIAWIKLVEYLRIIYNISLKNSNPDFKDLSPFVFKRFIKKYLLELHIDEKFLVRDLNDGFSGW